MKLGVLAGLLVLMGKHNRFWLIVLHRYHRGRARVSLCLIFFEIVWDFPTFVGKRLALQEPWLAPKRLSRAA